MSLRLLQVTNTTCRLTFMTDLATKIPLILETAFPSEWLDQKADDDPAARTNRAIQTEVCFHVSLRILLQPIMS